MKRRTKKQIEADELLAKIALEQQKIRMFHRGERVKLKSGLQVYRVLQSYWSKGHRRWLIQGRAGPCQFWRFQEDCEHA